MAVRKALGIVAMAGLFLLLLSALVVASPQESALARHIEPPTIPPDVMLTAQANGGSQGARMDVRLDVPPIDGLKRQPEGRRDANGRVLTAPRYAQSVYQVFRVEAAGG